MHVLKRFTAQGARAHELSKGQDNGWALKAVASERRKDIVNQTREPTAGAGHPTWLTRHLDPTVIRNLGIAVLAGSHDSLVIKFDVRREHQGREEDQWCLLVVGAEHKMGLPSGEQPTCTKRLGTCEHHPAAALELRLVDQVASALLLLQVLLVGSREVLQQVAHAGGNVLGRRLDVGLFRFEADEPAQEIQRILAPGVFIDHGNESDRLGQIETPTRALGNEGERNDRGIGVFGAVERLLLGRLAKAVGRWTHVGVREEGHEHLLVVGATEREAQKQVIADRLRDIAAGDGLRQERSGLGWPG